MPSNTWRLDIVVDRLQIVWFRGLVRYVPSVEAVISVLIAGGFSHCFLLLRSSLCSFQDIQIIAQVLATLPQLWILWTEKVHDLAMKYLDISSINSSFINRR